MKPTKEELDALAALRSALREREALALKIRALEAESTALHSRLGQVDKQVAEGMNGLRCVLSGKAGK